MIAVIVTGIVSLLVVATLDSVTTGLNLTRSDQNRNNAFQYANAGVDKAVYRLDRNLLPASDLASPSYTPTYDASGVINGFTESLQVGVSKYEIAVTQDPPGQTTRWRVASLGTDKPTGKQRLAIATVTAKPLFQNGFFTIEDFYLTGNQTTPIAYDSNTCPQAYTSCEIVPAPGGLGTNSKIIGAAETIDSFVERWQMFNMYGRATQEAAEGDCGIPSVNSDPSQANCAPYGGTVNAITDQLEYEPPAVPATAQPCDEGGNIGADNVVTYLAPGDYVCNDLTLRGTIVISPPGTVRLWAQDSFVVAEDSLVNYQRPTRTLQIYFPRTAGSSGTICGAEIWALLYTPGLDIDCQGEHQPELYGAVVANLHSGTGNQFHFHWDLASMYALNDGLFVVKDWRECPPGNTDC